MKNKIGKIQVYTGRGKGKTTAALGLALRACGHGYKVYFIQFMKGKINYGEKKIAPFISRFKLKAFGRPDFVDKNNPLEIDIKEAQKALNFASCIIQSKIYDLVILDEVNVALDFKLIKLSDLLKILDDKPEEVEVVLTGRAAHREVIKRADLVTEMKEIKHYYKENFSARKGIEY